MPALHFRLHLLTLAHAGPTCNLRDQNDPHRGDDPGARGGAAEPRPSGRRRAIQCPVASHSLSLNAKHLAFLGLSDLLFKLIGEILYTGLQIGGCTADLGVWRA